MTNAEQARTRRDEDYRRTRDTFNHMKLEDQATFLVEATASLLARGIEEAGRVMAEGVDEIFRPARKRDRAEQPGGPGPAEPETAQQRPPRGSAPDPDSSSD